MGSIPQFTDGTIDVLSKLLGEYGTGSDITRILKSQGLVDRSGESTKWRRLYNVFTESQKTYKSANHVLAFIKSFLEPTRFVGRKDEFEKARGELNEILILSGLEFGVDGNFRKLEAAKTLDEAERRVQTIRNKFQNRNIHPEVWKYCKTELMQKNYFHAVLEATKGLFQRIRDLSGVKADGPALIDKVFSIENPILVFNTLQTETEKTDHKGVAMLLKGCFSTIRSPRAHEPKILWDGEDDTADFMTLISLLHRKLDGCIRIQN